jgi:hypothetical protein
MNDELKKWMSDQHQADIVFALHQRTGTIHLLARTQRGREWLASQFVILTDSGVDVLEARERDELIAELEKAHGFHVPTYANLTWIGA